MVTIDELSDQVQALRNATVKDNLVAGTASGTLTGHGYFFPDGGRLAALDVAVTSAPDYYGFEGVKGEDGYILDAGWVIPYTNDNLEGQRYNIGAYHALIVLEGLLLAGVYYFLAPGVEIVCTPYYPAPI
jgi:hypothetical protein